VSGDVDITRIGSVADHRLEQLHQLSTQRRRGVSSRGVRFVLFCVSPGVVESKADEQTQRPSFSTCRSPSVRDRPAGIDTDDRL
jgi:hypothetical protein